MSLATSPIAFCQAFLILVRAPSTVRGSLSKSALILALALFIALAIISAVINPSEAIFLSPFDASIAPSPVLLNSVSMALKINGAPSATALNSAPFNLPAFMD